MNNLISLLSFLKHKIMIKNIFPLAMGGLALGTTEFIIMGLLRNIGADMNISDALTGHFISAYALGVIVGAPLLVAFFSRYKAKTSLQFFMLLFTIFNGLSALMPNYTSFLVARFCAGLPHGAFFGIGAIAAKSMAKKGKEATAISIMFLGLTLANVIMIPLLTFVGNEVGWRVAMGIVASLGLLTFLSIYFYLPNVSIIRSMGIRQEIAYFFNKHSLVILLITALGCGGLFSWLSYIEPLLLEVAGFSSKIIPWAMTLIGVGMVVGNMFGGFLADKISPIKATQFILLMLVLALFGAFSLSHFSVFAWFFTFVCAVLAMSLGAPLNMMMFASAPKSEIMGAAFMQAAFNTANALGAFLGGLPLLYHFSANYPSLVGSTMAFIGLCFCLFLFQRGYSK